MSLNFFVKHNINFMIILLGWTGASAKMNTFAVAVCCWALAAHAYAQPVACNDESHCAAGFFCETDVHLCQECLRCEDLKRLPPQQPSSCIESFTQCGRCYDGLVENILGGLTAQCVNATAGQQGSLPVYPGSPDQGSVALYPGTRHQDSVPYPNARDQESLPVYAWVAIVAGLMFLVILVAIIVCALRNKEIFKSVVSGETSVLSRAGGEEPPPPYHEHYAPARPSSPPEHAPAHHADPADEASWPFMTVKPAGVAGVSGVAGGAAREAAGAQAARVFSNPSYVRGPPPPHPPTYEVEEPEPHSPFTVHDEETMESPWTPHENNNAEDSTAVAIPEEAAGTVARSEPPPAKRARLPQDNNNNGESSNSASTSAASLTINVLVQQRNDLRL